MNPREEFDALLSSLLRKTAQDPGAPAAIPLDRWPAGSSERRLLEDLQAAMDALQSQDQDHSSHEEAGKLRYQAIFQAAGDGLILSDAETGRIIEANAAACAMYGYPDQTFIGTHIANLIPPDSSHSFAAYLQEARSQGASTAQQSHLRRDGSQFYVEMSAAAVPLPDRTGFLLVVRDVSRRLQAEQMLQQQVEAHNREQFTLLEISQTLASVLELQPGQILDQMRVIIDYTHAGLFKLEASALTALAVRGSQALERAMPFQIQLRSPEAPGMLFNGQQPSRIGDVQSADPAARLLRSLLDDQASLLLAGVQSWMWVPLAIKSRMIGAIGLAHTRPDFFTAHHADLALTVANQAAITMANAELYENAQTLAALQERQRLARNLHDAVNQSLFSAGLIAEVLPRLWERSPEEGLQSLEDLRRLTRGAQADMRLLLAELRPSTLTDVELGDLLRLLGNALAGRTNIPVDVTVSGEGKLPADVQVALYRLCQEGLTNIAKHAGASQVEVQVAYETSAVELRIQDDGRGFDPSQTPPGHYGLSMMRERAAAIGATLSIHSQPGHGAEITVRWAAPSRQKAD